MEHVVILILRIKSLNTEKIQNISKNNNKTLSSTIYLQFVHHIYFLFPTYQN